MIGTVSSFYSEDSGVISTQPNSTRPVIKPTNETSLLPFTLIGSVTYAPLNFIENQSRVMDLNTAKKIITNWELAYLKVILIFNSATRSRINYNHSNSFKNMKKNFNAPDMYMSKTWEGYWGTFVVAKKEEKQNLDYWKFKIINRVFLKFQCIIGVFLKIKRHQNAAN